MTPATQSTEISLHDPKLASLIIEHAVEYAIFTLDLAGAISSWSHGAEAILGYSREEVLGRNFSFLFTAPDVLAGIPEREIQKAAAVGRAEDTRWHLRRDGTRFWANGVTMAIPNSEPAMLLKVMRDETPAKLAEDQRVLLLNELNHRIKNTLATVQSIAERTLRAKGVAASIRADFVQRLMALSQAHNVLVTQNWAGADLRQIVETAISPHDQPGQRSVSINGPDVRMSPQQAITLSIGLHELATNALKYGALSHPSGRVTVSWNLSYDAAGRRGLTFLWEEEGGPPVEPPTREGFGSQLLARLFREEAGGAARLDFRPTGLRFVAEIPLSDQEASFDQDPLSLLPTLDD